MMKRTTHSHDCSNRPVTTRNGIRKPAFVNSSPQLSTSSGRVITTQITSNVWKYENDWAYDLCDCGEDIQQCCFAYWCLPLYLCELFDRTNECLCTPCCIPLALMSLREKLRTGFRIKGSIYKDCLIVSFCPCCSAMQMRRELDNQGL